MSNLILLLTVLALCAVQILATNPRIDEGFDDRSYDVVGRPFTSVAGSDDRYYDAVGRPSTPTDRCKKDILLVVDTSYSIGKVAFNNQVKPFLEHLVNDKDLNVGRDGTQIALIIFSEARKTKLLLPFGEIYDKDELAKYFDKELDWEKVQGDRTRTDLALHIANDEVFRKQSPQNNRPDAYDVVIIITDGEPIGKWNTRSEAIRNARILKDKDIDIVSAAVGPNRKKFRHTLEEMASSKEYTFEADFNNLENIRKKIIKHSCNKSGGCICSITAVAKRYVKPGYSEAIFSWTKPKYECSKGAEAEELSFTVNPPVTSPHPFSIGKHKIIYTYRLNGDVKVNCSISFEVKGEVCRGIEFNPSTQACCCGTIHTKQQGNYCCGQDYYDPLQQKCCPHYTLVSGRSCPS